MKLFQKERQSLTDIISDVLTTLLYLSFIVYASDTVGMYIMAALTVAIFLLNFLAKGGIKFHIGKFHVYLLLFTSFSFISSFWALSPEDAITKGITLLSILLVFTLLYASYYDASLERLLKIIMWGGLVLGLYTITFVGVDTLRDTIQSEERLDNSFANINNIGMCCCTSLIVGLYFYKKQHDLIALLFCIPALFVVAASGSRKALVMLILGALFILLVSNKSEHKRKSKFFRYLGFAIVFIGLIFFAVNSGIFVGSMERMDGLIASVTGAGKADPSSILRNYFRLIGFNQFAETPLVGIGMGNAHLLAQKFVGINCYLHCNYAELAANGGLVGLILYYWIYVYVIKKEWSARKYDNYSNLILFLVLIQLVMDYGAVSYYSKQTYFILMVAVLHIQHIKKKKSLRCPRFS